jgi:hypothetical protein
MSEGQELSKELRDTIDAIGVALGETPGEPEFPITVYSIEYGGPPPLLPPKRGKCGDFVAVRPVGNKYGDKTYLGVMLGDLAISLGYDFNRTAGIMTIRRGFHNPAMFVPDLGEVIQGCQSWWSLIKKPEDLEQITDRDIDNIWYVKALKKLKEADLDGG